MNRRLVFTAYNRPRYFSPVMTTWWKVREYADWQPRVFLEPGPAEHTMTRIATTYGAQVHLNPHRRGVLSNPWHALDTAFTEGADFVVLAEDDVMVSDDVLEYFTYASAAFRTDHVLGICANSNATTCSPADEGLLRRTKAINPLVWGTWADRWTGVLRDTWDHSYSSGTPDAPQSGWDWNIALRVIQDWTVIAPYASRSTHIGEYGGTHCTVAQFPDTVAPTFNPCRPRTTYRLED